MRTLALCASLLACLAAAPARAEGLALRHTRLLDVQLAGTAALPTATAEVPVRRSVAWALLPFGLGQFANDQPVKGGLLCAGQILAFGTFAASLAAFESNKITGEFGKWGTFQDTGLARTLQTTYLVAFWTGVALVAVGIVDALVFRPTGDTVVALGPGSLAMKF